MENKIMTAAEFMSDYMYKEYGKYRTNTQFQQPSHEDCIDMLNKYVAYRLKAGTRNEVEQAIEAEYPTLPGGKVPDVIESAGNDALELFRSMARHWYALGRNRSLEWINADATPPTLYQPCAFIVESPHEHYNGRILGGTYQGKRDTGNPYHEFAVPGIGFKATLWQPLPVAAPQEIIKETTN